MRGDVWAAIYLGKRGGSREIVNREVAPCHPEIEYLLHEQRPVYSGLHVHVTSRLWKAPPE